MKHTSYRGNQIDMELLKFQNQHKVAVGNANMNARGDIIGRGGTVIKTREQLLQEKETARQKPDINPDMLRQMSPQSEASNQSTQDDGFDDSIFENVVQPEPVQNVQQVQVQSTQEEPEIKKAPQKRKSKDSE